jgi:hypothetical protein
VCVRVCACAWGEGGGVCGAGTRPPFYRVPLPVVDCWATFHLATCVTRYRKAVDKAQKALAKENDALKAKSLKCDALLVDIAQQVQGGCAAACFLWPFSTFSIFMRCPRLRPAGAPVCARISVPARVPVCACVCVPPVCYCVLVCVPLCVAVCVCVRASEQRSEDRAAMEGAVTQRDKLQGLCRALLAERDALKAEVRFGFRACGSHPPECARAGLGGQGRVWAGQCAYA